MYFGENWYFHNMEYCSQSLGDGGMRVFLYSVLTNRDINLNPLRSDHPFLLLHIDGYFTIMQN